MTPASAGVAGDPPALRDAMVRDGYLFLPGLLPRAAVLAGMRRFMREVGPAVAAGPGEGDVRIGDPGREEDNGITQAAKTDVLLADADIRRVVGHPDLVGLFERLFGEECVAYDYKWFRLVKPGASTDFHMDSAFFGRSRSGGPLDSRLYTLWFPWHDLPAEVGGITLLEGSSRLPGFARLRSTYGTAYDTCNSDIDSPYVAGPPKVGAAPTVSNEPIKPQGSRPSISLDRHPEGAW